MRLLQAFWPGNINNLLNSRKDVVHIFANLGVTFPYRRLIVWGVVSFAKSQRMKNILNYLKEQ